MEHQAVLESAEFGNAISFTMRQLDDVGHLFNVHQARFKLAVLKNLIELLPTYDEEVSTTGPDPQLREWTEKGAARFMNDIGDMTKVFPPEKRHIIIASTAFALAEQILAEMIDRNAAALSAV